MVSQRLHGIDFHDAAPWRRWPKPKLTAQTPANKPLPWFRLRFNGTEAWRPLPQAKSTLQTPPETAQTAHTQVNWPFDSISTVETVETAASTYSDRPDPDKQASTLLSPSFGRQRAAETATTSKIHATITARDRTDSSNTGKLAFKQPSALVSPSLCRGDPCHQSNTRYDHRQRRHRQLKDRETDHSSRFLR